MTIQVKHIDGGYKNINSYQMLTIQGLTSTGETFVENVESREWYVLDNNSGEYIYFSSTSPIEKVLNSKKYIISDFKQKIKSFINETAISCGYDSTEDFITYINSNVPLWKSEAESFMKWRDSIIVLMYNNIKSFMTGNLINLPINIEDFTAQKNYTPLQINKSRMYIGNYQYSNNLNDNNIFITIENPKCGIDCGND